MVPRTAFLDLGGFDRSIFLYHEDDDLSLRALARRIPIVVVTQARVTHAGGRSTTPSFGQTFRINRAKMHSELYVREKYGRAGSGRRGCFGWVLAARWRWRFSTCTGSPSGQESSPAALMVCAGTCRRTYRFQH